MTREDVVSQAKGLGLSGDVVSISSIKANPNNPRVIKDERFEKLKNSIREFPKMMALRPMVVDEAGIVLGGNMRLRALEALGYTSIPLEWVKHSDELTEKEKERFIIEDNVPFGEWDWDSLANEWDETELGEWGLETAWDTIEPTETPTAEEDDFDEETDEVECVCKAGDVWQLGRHRLMCGDSTKAEDVARLMDGAKADLVFTDPPYGQNYQSNFRKATPKMDKLANDDRILDFFPILDTFCKGFIFICTGWKVLSKWLPLFEKYHELTNMIIWDKGGGGLGSLSDTFLTDYEIILVSHNGAKITGKRLGSVWSVGKDDVNAYNHPTQKPVLLSATAIENTTNVGGSVLDLFGGSGSTLIACEQLNRTCYMMELDPHYCDVIIARWEKLTGNKAKKI